MISPLHLSRNCRSSDHEPDSVPKEFSSSEDITPEQSPMSDESATQVDLPGPDLPTISPGRSPISVSYEMQN